jgi:hypothetical protein
MINNILDITHLPNNQFRQSYFRYSKVLYLVV